MIMIKHIKNLKKIGLEHTITSNEGRKFTLPTTTTVGEFNGSSPMDVRKTVRQKISKAFTKIGLTSEKLISVRKYWSHFTT